MCYLCVICVLFVCYLCVICVLFVCYLCVICVLFVCYLCVICVLFVCYLCVICVLFVCYLCVICVLFVCYLCVICVLFVFYVVSCCGMVCCIAKMYWWGVLCVYMIYHSVPRYSLGVPRYIASNHTHLRNGQQCSFPTPHRFTTIYLLHNRLIRSVRLIIIRPDEVFDCNITPCRPGRCYTL